MSDSATDQAGAAIPAEPSPAGEEPAAARCRNCQAPLTGPYCAACGQSAHLHRSLAGLGHDILHGVFHFEGKVWRTLPELIWRPGQLTRRYIEGERSRYISPLALFLFSVFLTFAVLSWTGGIHLGSDGDSSEPVEIARITDSIDEWRRTQRAEAQRLEEKLRKRRQDLALPALDADDRTKLEDEIGRLDRKRQILLAAAAGDNASLDRLAQEQRLAPVSEPASTSRGSLDLDLPGLDERLSARLKHLGDNPALLAYKLKTNGYKYSWALIPLSLPFMWLLFFWRRDVFLYDHTVFVAHSISFMMLLGVVAALLGTLGLSNWILIPALTVLPPLHLYRHLRDAYGLSRWGARLRLALLCFAILLVLLLFGTLLFLLGLL
ncbi:DUF3667 domain-containing protein [Stagnimonas aquatica]|uniref:DUF3667 domain-containing protein n=1 Tax=Stagnimonas aquatica TaxID=2689987 RepID=UPI00131516CC|nr:DUF3667 domain-containing protein [Stagnimonas aquatica]